MSTKNNFFSQRVDSENQDIATDDMLLSNVTITIKREDTLHEFVSGNKYRKRTFGSR